MSPDQMPSPSDQTESEQRMSPEAQAAIAAYQDARNERDPEQKVLKALVFVQRMGGIVEANPHDPTGEMRWDRSSRQQAFDMIFQENALYVGSGTAGCRIYFDSENPKTDERGEWMYYLKPSESNWMYGGDYWQRFMNHFKSEIVDLNRNNSRD